MGVNSIAGNGKKVMELIAQSVTKEDGLGATIFKDPRFIQKIRVMGADGKESIATIQAKSWEQLQSYCESIKGEKLERYKAILWEKTENGVRSLTYKKHYIDGRVVTGRTLTMEKPQEWYKPDITSEGGVIDEFCKDNRSGISFLPRDVIKTFDANGKKLIEIKQDYPEKIYLSKNWEIEHAGTTGEIVTHLENAGTQINTRKILGYSFGKLCPSDKRKPTTLIGQAPNDEFVQITKYPYGYSYRTSPEQTVTNYFLADGTEVYESCGSLSQRVTQRLLDLKQMVIAAFKEGPMLTKKEEKSLITQINEKREAATAKMEKEMAKRIKERREADLMTELSQRF